MHELFHFYIPRARLFSINMFFFLNKKNRKFNIFIIKYLSYDKEKFFDSDELINK